MTNGSARRASAPREVRAGTFWAASLLVSLSLLVLLLLIWSDAGTFEFRGNELVDRTAVLCEVPERPSDLTTDCDPPGNTSNERTCTKPEEAAECTMTGASPPPPTGRLKDQTDPAQLRTGVFIQTLEFRSAKNVQMTGYIWQRVPGDRTSFDGDVSQPEQQQEQWTLDADGEQIEVELGVVLPEQVDSTFPLARVYETWDGASGMWTIGYYFETTVRQQFDYSRYPFDSEPVWLRMWPRSLTADVILVPDFQAYEPSSPNPPPPTGYPCPLFPAQQCTGTNQVFGIDPAIALDGFDIDNTFFDYHYPYDRHALCPQCWTEDQMQAEGNPPGYVTNLGLPGWVQLNYPELRFNFVLQRDAREAYLANLVPLSVAAGLVFSVLMTITANERRKEALNIDTALTMGQLVAVFIAVLLVHIQLRQRFDGLVYFEFFYFLLYLVILGVALNNMLIAIPATGRWPLFTFGDNLIPKILFWPTILATAVVVSAAALTHDIVPFFPM